MNRVRAFAPASVGNAGVGFDILGFAVDVCGDVVEVSAGDPGVRILSVSGSATKLPLIPSENTATAGLLQLIADKRLPFGFDVRIDKGIPMGSGLGGSAASAVASIVAASSLLDTPLSTEEMLKYAMIGEALSSGSAHLDNVIPSLLGGLQICKANYETIEIPVPDGLSIVLVHPSISIETAMARAILPQSVSLKTQVRQAEALATFISCAFKNDAEGFARSCVDYIAEPYRAELIPGFTISKTRALAAGAWSFSISGSGPTMFSFCRPEIANTVKELIVGVFDSQRIETTSWVSSISMKGAKIENFG